MDARAPAASGQSLSRLLRRAAGLLLWVFLRIWIATLRVELEGPGLGGRRRRDGLPLPPGRERPRVYAFFHGTQMGILAARLAQSEHPITVMVSHSLDGELQTSLLSRFDFSVVRGSSSRGGATALAGVVRRLCKGSDAAFAADGPRGPRGVVKPGCIWAASRSRGLLLPVSSAASRSWVLRRAWDRFEIPLPFSRVAVVVGEPVDPTRAAADPTILADAICAAESRACALLRDGVGDRRAEAA